MPQCLSFSVADITLAGPVSLLVACFDGARICGYELLCWAYSSQPITIEIGKVVTGTPCPLALNEGMSSEILKAATSRSQ